MVASNKAPGAGARASTEQAADPRLRSPSAARNRDVVLDALAQRLPDGARVLEVGCGSGEHAVHFAQALPRTVWLPSDINPDALASTAAWIEASGVSNVAAPIALDVEDLPWRLAAEDIDTVLSLNMIHIAPLSVTSALIRGAAQLLRVGGKLVLYGPFKRGGHHTAPSNESFDRWLKQRDERFGVRDLEAVEEQASTQGLLLSEIVEMPANNFTVFFERAARAE